MNQILVELQESMGSDLSIANAAWTSTYNKDTREDKYDDPSKVANIVERLIKDGHGAPIESVVFRFWIRMPIFTDRQHMTHRVGSHNGLSGRYRTMPTDYYDLPEDVNDILYKVSQPHVEQAELIQDSKLSWEFVKFARREYDLSLRYLDSCGRATDNYSHSMKVLKQAEKDNVITNAELKRAREVLRGQLPTSGMVERTTIMNLRSFANYQKQRNSDHAQPEIRDVAQKMLIAVEEANIAPVAIATLKSMGWVI